jgi:hypothetical protein
MESNRPNREKLFLIICIGTGMLAILPYLVWMIFYFLDQGESLTSGIAQVALGIVLILAPCNGFFFGAAGLVIGSVLFFRKSGRYYARRFAVILPGLLMGFIGLVLNIWWWYIILKTA